MPTVSTITPQKFKRGVNVFLDGKFGFGLDMETFVKSGLKEGQELSETEIKNLTEKSGFQRNLDNLLRFATLRPRSEKEVNDRFIKHKVDEVQRIKLKEKLINLDLLDDLKFAKWWIGQRQNFRPKPKSILYHELSIKGIKKEIITELLSETEIDEKSQIKQLLQKNAYKRKRYDKKTARQKMAAFLMRKGFGWEAIRNEISN